MIVVEAPTLNTFKNRVDKLWKDIMYNNELDLYTLTSRRNTRYAQYQEPGTRGLDWPSLRILILYYYIMIGRCRSNDEQLAYVETRVECLQELG